ncbi:MAG: hypothetical protein A4E53_03645 [Pelotomaculum sp. PtaB.Bin104]|nr:MAG: hypothetical protein A4E53_03645 [Pelotomaculum sp. PtaB.Bin104]
MSLFQRLNNIKNRPARVEPGISLAVMPEGQEVSSKFGVCVMLETVEPGALPFPAPDPAVLHTNLQLVRGIGPVTEGQLRRQGFSCVSDLLVHPKWMEPAGEVLSLLQGQRVGELQLLGAGTWELLSYFSPEEILFLDIETTGLWASQPLFLIGFLYYRLGRLHVNQFLARHYREEKAVLAAAQEVFSHYKVVVSFNGKRFDVPYISGRSIEHRLFYSYPHHQVDLLFHAKRHFGGVLPNCRLVTLEEHLLNFRREDDLPGYLIPQTYHRFTQKQDLDLIWPIIEHNRLDLLAMARLFRPVLQGSFDDDNQTTFQESVRAR